MCVYSVSYRPQFQINFVSIGWLKIIVNFVPIIIVKLAGDFMLTD